MGKLKEILLAREAAVEAGNYPELKLQKEDPIQYEILHTRVAGLVQNAREKARQISASPVVREMGECVFSLFTPEGDSVCFSNGLLLHVASLGGTVKWMIRNNYEEDVGFNPGDYFMNNDPHVGGAHSPDQTTVTPIFYKGEIVGWAGGLIHVLETGATEPGGTSPAAISRYDEGIFWPCVKVAENEQPKKDLENIVKRGTRMPFYWLLDSRASMAGDRLIREGVLEIIEEFGIDFYLQAIYEFIEDSRQAAKRKIRDLLFPGKYTQIGQLAIQNKGMPMRMAMDHNVRIPCETTVTPDGELFLDFDGTSPHGPHSSNASLPSLMGNIIDCLIQYVFYDLKPNQGLFQTFKLNVPISIINPPISAACSGWISAVIATTSNIMNVSRAQYSMGFREEVTAGFLIGPAMITGGLDQYGRPFGAMNFEAMCCGMGAMGFMDGLNACYAAPNAEGDFSDVEVWEKIMPQMWLGRRIHMDGGGHGKYQGGAGIETLYLQEHTDHCEIGGTGPFYRVFSIPSLMGAYPASCCYHWYATDTNVQECIDKKLPLPYFGGENPAEPQWEDMLEAENHLLPAQVVSRPVKKHDLWQQFANGGGGIGDPIERDPKLVARDLKHETISHHSALSVYGVIVDPDTGEADMEKTRIRRDEIRARRKERGLPTQDYISQQRKKILEGDLPEISLSCLNQCLANSEKFRGQFREFWGLSDDVMQITPKA